MPVCRARALGRLRELALRDEGYLLAFSVLLFYSVGQYQFRGGTRFLLILVSVAAPAALLAVYILSPGTQRAAARVDEPARSAQVEHDAIARWAVTLPAEAIMVSPIAYVWESFGRFSVMPE